MLDNQNSLTNIWEHDLNILLYNNIILLYPERPNESILTKNQRINLVGLYVNLIGPIQNIRR